MRVYIAASLSNEAERVFNLHLRDFIRSEGFDTYLPQEDGGLLSDLINTNVSEDEIRENLFKRDYQEIKNCDIILCLLDGRIIDEGVCFELGAAYALGKDCFAFKTDSRSSLRGHDNLMVEGSLRSISKSWDELRDNLKAYK